MKRLLIVLAVLAASAFIGTATASAQCGRYYGGYGGYRGYGYQSYYRPNYAYPSYGYRSYRPYYGYGGYGGYGYGYPYSRFSIGIW